MAYCPVLAGLSVETWRLVSGAFSFLPWAIFLDSPLSASRLRSASGSAVMSCSVRSTWRVSPGLRRRAMVACALSRRRQDRDAPHETVADLLVRTRLDLFVARRRAHRNSRGAGRRRGRVAAVPAGADLRGPGLD